MARAAFVMDRLMHALGLHGKSFLPMLVGFGCTVPGVYATRTLESEDDRKLTGFLVPMMSCGARLPVYVIFAAAFFPHNPGQFIFALYLTGIVFAIITGVVMKRTIFKGKPPSPFVMELPPYRVPTLRGVLIHMWERSSVFVRRAATIIMAVSIILWFLMSIPWGVEEPRDSLFGKASAAISPLFAPAGFGNWEASGSLVTGFVAKEVVVGTMSQIYVGEAEAEEAEEPTTFFQDLGEIVVSFWDATVDTVKMAISIIPGVDLMGEGEEEEEDTALIEALQEDFTPLSAVAFNVFVLLYVPCMVAIAAQRHEYGTKWMLFNAGYLTALGWVVAVIIYQGGRLLGLG
jgi:ferrous iron transport protein B